MKRMSFRHHFADQIIDGKKNVTWRLYDDKDLQKGDELELIDAETGARFAKAVIVDMREKKLGEIDDVDYVGHETYMSNDDMIETYRGYYGPQVDKNTVAKIIQFKLI